MRMTGALWSFVAAVGFFGFGREARAQESRPPKRWEVDMVERGQYGLAFDPQRLTAQLGDTIRFVQRGGLPHNVRFRSTPDGVELAEAEESPMLTAPGDVWDLLLDRRFRPGKYFYVCVPHEVMGMAGILYVQGTVEDSSHAGDHGT